MNSEKFSLKWNDFQQTVSNSFKVLRKEGNFFDVTLVSNDESLVKGHKVVLSACSKRGRAKSRFSDRGGAIKRPRMDKMT